MPGIVVFRRRWSVGSDDLVVPGVFLFTVHLIWTVILTVFLSLATFENLVYCELQLLGLVLGYVVILVFSMALELAICVVAMKGSILDTAPRSSMQYILYFRVAIMLIEGGWLSAGVAWFVRNYFTCKTVNPMNPKETVLGMVVCNWCILFSVLITVWCTYDAAGRSWVKMKQYQRSMRESESKFQYKRSGSTRNWRQRKVLRAYQDSWQQRCRFLFCCSSASDRNRNSFADIARLLSDFFRDLDVVPSDVIAGLVLLRKFQKIERKAIVEQRNNDTYEFLSGVAVTSRTQFLSLQEGADLELFQTVIHFAHFAVRAYGWPIYVMTSSMGLCRLCTDLRCFCCLPCQKPDSAEIVKDNCCKCNYAALQKLTSLGDIEIIYVTYHVDVGQTPFFVALDYDRKKVVISIRGTLSMKDILTDLNAEGETLPLNPPREDWLGHKGMVQAAQYILEKLQEEQLIERALQHAPERGTPEFQIVIVGHSLGAGTASILGILLRQYYASLKCYCYSPPGGLLSLPAVEYTKAFTVSVVVGKDVVPRIGLNQMETLRADLINAIKRSVDPKWKTITCSIVCCGCSQPTSAVELSTGESDVGEYMRSKRNARGGLHPSDSTIALTSHQPLYPPGRIIHVVRHHPTRGEQALSNREPVYQALWANNTDFDEVLISPVMIQDHMPDKVLDALNKVVTTLGPRKPQRSSSSNPQKCWEEDGLLSGLSPTPPHRVYLETSFTSLQSPSSAPSNASSVTNGYYSTRSQPSPIFPITKSLSLTLKRQTPSPALKLDLIHDDWFGLAPLASPESLSEVSSISSRASVLVTQTTICEINTPKIMRRTPKIIGSLSTCADDIRNVRNFQKAEVFLRCSNSDSPATNSSSNLSYESAASSKCNDPEIKCCESDEFQSAEDILDNVLASAGCKDFFNNNSGFLETHFDMFDDNPKTSKTVQSPSTPQDIDPDIISNFAIDLNLDEEHRSLQFVSRSAETSKPNSVDSGSVCRTPSDTKNVTFNPQVINIDSSMVSTDYSSPRKHWHLFKGRKHKSGETRVTSPRIIPDTPVPKTILCVKRRNSEEECFSRTEALPLLSGLNINSERTSPSFVRRKKYVYPLEMTIKGESSV
ncbi:diacylglycerol lipase-alpha isoform X2 [Tribolium madens]|uniref:diacylglycerol lipase-alpha isoform X2 n=1 Tax=Tribolium madens TaxID=41895 RepID=UPI001CF7653D|nr:diacylglycerol lipase-alpha isoform X2 [Tribolium madens]